jgi:small-conductance mechanosensitive channel
MRRVLVLVLLVLLFSPLLGGPATAQRVGSSDVQVFPFDPPGEMLLGETVTYDAFAVYNGGTTTYLVEARLGPIELGFVGTTDPSFLFLGPGESDTFRVTLTAPAAGFEGVANIEVVFRVENVATNVADTLSVVTQTRLLGLTPGADPQGKILGMWPNPMPFPLDNEIGAFLATVVLWTLIALAIVYVISPVARRLAAKTETEVDDIILGILRGPVFLLVLVFGAITSVEILGVGVEIRLLLQQIYSFAFVLIATWIAYRIFRDVLIYYGRKLSQRGARDLGTRLVPALDKIGSVVIVIMGLVFAVQSLGFDITLFLAGMGVIGLIIAFAAQDTLSNLFAGLHIMLDRPFRVGDLIEVEPGVICEVADIGLRSTKLYWKRDHVILIIPNREIADKKIVNYVRPDYMFRTTVDVGVAYGTDLAKLDRVLVGIALAHPDVLKEEEHKPEMRVVEFGDSAIVCRLIFWVADVRKQWRVRSDVNKAIDRRFKEEGIEIPFPQRVVWMKESAGEDDSALQPGNN